jgi:4-hydroxy-L-threonine phosphate dehydrogenase PdxA
MMLWLPAADGDGLGVVHATLHESLRTALARLSPAAIEAAGTRLASLLAALLGRPPRIAVAALNPHAGEGGLFGDDEAAIVAPAVAALASAGIAVAGPLPADTHTRSIARVQPGCRRRTGRHPTNGTAQNERGSPSMCSATYDRIRFVEIGATW